ncbi:MAG: signal peptidase II, partial [Acidimicrobiia bacterium]|nr:signal peptidase II [Acidimicrobiia bacterium]
APTAFVGMIVGGALGNIADRAFRAGDGLLGGEVIDFIDVRFWPVFNVADSAVVVGVILLAGYSVFIEPRHHRDEPVADEPGPSAGDGPDASDQSTIDNP